MIRRLVYVDNQSAWQVDTSNRAVIETGSERQVNYSPVNRTSGYAVRLTNGMWVQDIQVTLPIKPNVEDDRGAIRITLVDDFAGMAPALEKMVAATLAGQTDALGPLPFRRRVVLGSLYQSMGISRTVR